MTEPNWRDSLPEELKSAPALKDVADVGSLAKQFVDQQTYMGQSIRVPGADAGAQDKEEFYNKLRAKVPGLVKMPDPEDELATKAFWRNMGLPEDKDKYNLPESAKELPNELFQTLKANAYENNMTQKQFEKAANKMMEALGSQKAEVEKRKAALKEAWGNAHESNLDKIKTYAEQAKAPESLKKAINDGSIGVEEANWILSVADAVGGESNLGGDGDGAVPSKMSPTRAKEIIAEIYRNPDHPYHNERAIGHKEAVDRMIELVAASNPKMSKDLNSLNQGIMNRTY